MIARFIGNIPTMNKIKKMLIINACIYAFPVKVKCPRSISYKSEFNDRQAGFDCSSLFIRNKFDIRNRKSHIFNII